MAQQDFAPTLVSSSCLRDVLLDKEIIVAFPVLNPAEPPFCFPHLLCIYRPESALSISRVLKLLQGGDSCACDLNFVDT